MPVMERRCAWDWDYLFTCPAPPPFEESLRFEHCYLSRERRLTSTEAPMHREKRPKDTKPIDTDAMGYDAREHAHGQHLPDTHPQRSRAFTRPLGVNGRVVALRPRADWSDERENDAQARALRQQAMARANRPLKLTRVRRWSEAAKSLGRMLALAALLGVTVALVALVAHYAGA